MTQATNCPDDAELTASLQGSLPSREADLVAMHLEQCPRCAARVDQLLSKLPQPVSNPQPAFDIEPRPVSSELTQVVELLRSSKDIRRLSEGQAETGNPFDQRAAETSAEAMPFAASPVSLVESDPELIRRVVPYRIIRELDGRPEWRLFAAHDPVLQRTVWLQVLRRNTADAATSAPNGEPVADSEPATESVARPASTDARHEFIQRADSLARCVHPAIATVFEVQRDGPCPLVVLEAGTGNSLAQLVELVAPGVADAVAMVQSAVAACQVAAANGLQPRSLRLDAIHVAAAAPTSSRSRIPKLLLIDFVSAGTSDVPSPSRLAGAMLHELLTGREPALQELRDGSRVLESPGLIRVLNPAVPLSVVRWITALLNETRPEQSLDDTARQLARLNVRRVPASAMIAAAIVLLGMVVALIAGNPDHVVEPNGTERPGDAPQSPAYQSPVSQSEPLDPVDRISSATTDSADSADSAGSAGYVPSVNPVLENAGTQPATAASPPFEPLSEAWLSLVRQVPAEQQLQSVIEELQRRNPRFDGRYRHELRDEQVDMLFVFSDSLRDISPVRAFPELKVLCCPGQHPESGILRDLSPLQGLPLEGLWVGWTQVSDLSPLRGMPLREVGLGRTAVTDLEPLRDCPLENLELWWTRVTDLSPLSGQTHLQRLRLSDSAVNRLEPLRGLPIRELQCEHVLVQDWEVLADLPQLETLRITYIPSRHRELLSRIPKLSTINGQPAAEFLAR